MGRLLFCAVRGLIRTAFKNVRILSSELVWKPLFLPRYREVFLPFSTLFPLDFGSIRPASHTNCAYAKGVKMGYMVYH